jgi:hypothetical protein
MQRHLEEASLVYTVVSDSDSGDRLKCACKYNSSITVVLQRLTMGPWGLMIVPWRLTMAHLDAVEAHPGAVESQFLLIYHLRYGYL